MVTSSRPILPRVNIAFLAFAGNFSGPSSQSRIRHNYLLKINIGFVLQLGGYIPLLLRLHTLVANSLLHFQSPRLQTTDLIREYL